MLHYSTHINSNENAKWVVFIHGAGGSSSIWYKQINSFRKHFNLLFIDLRGHGQNSVNEIENQKKEYSLNSISLEVIEVIKYCNIEKANFIGVSLGTILIREIIKIDRKIIDQIIMTGAIIRLNLFSIFLIWFGNMVKKIAPYMLLYKLFAIIIMPRKNHKNSRKTFIIEAKKLNKYEFIRWFGITKTLNSILKKYENETHNLPILFLTGRQDHLFIKDVQKMAEKEKNAEIEIIENCGHVVNIEQAEIFNKLSLKFLTK